MAEYGSSDYWNERYAKDNEPFEWYQPYEGLEALLTKYIKHRDNVVMVPGCGNSALSDKIREHHANLVLSNDISDTVITEMSMKSTHKKGLEYKVMDVRKLDYKNESIDVIVDKGTVDSIICGEDAERNTDLVLHEYLRVLKPGGVALIVSYGAPDSRQHFLKKDTLEWDILPVVSLPKPSIVFEEHKTGHAAINNSSNSNVAQEVHYAYAMIKWKTSL